MMEEEKCALCKPPEHYESRLKIVDWGYSCGRCFLEVAGITVAVEGDIRREFPDKCWTPKLLKEVVDKYEEMMKEKEQ